MKSFRITFQTPPDEFDPGGESIVVVSATCPEQALIKANVWYYGETVPTSTPPHPVTVKEVL